MLRVRPVGRPGGGGARRLGHVIGGGRASAEGVRGGLHRESHRHNSRGIVLSWALEGQGGASHVNERNNDYVKASVRQGLRVCDPEAEALRASAAPSRTSSRLLVFRRIGAESDDATAASLLDECRRRVVGLKDTDLASFDRDGTRSTSRSSGASRRRALRRQHECEAAGGKQAEFAAPSVSSMSVAQGSTRSVLIGACKATAFF